MDSRKEELCSNLIYQSYQGKDSFCSSCLPGWDRWKVGGKRTTSALKFWGLGTLGCKCKGEQVVNPPYIKTLCPCRVGSPSKVPRKCGCVGVMPGHTEHRVPLPDLPSMWSSTSTNNKKEEATEDQALRPQQVMILGVYFVAWAHLPCLRETLGLMQ